MIRMEHLNHHANLYAGRGIEWMVESAFMAACLTHGDKNGLLYKNMHRFDFSRSVEPGDIVRYESTVVRAGRTRLPVHVDLKNEQTGDLYAEERKAGLPDIQQIKRSWMITIYLTFQSERQPGSFWMPEKTHRTLSSMRSGTCREM